MRPRIGGSVTRASTIKNSFLVARIAHCLHLMGRRGFRLSVNGDITKANARITPLFIQFATACEEEAQRGMNWTDDALLLSARPHGESALLVTLLTREHGRHAGLVTGGQSRRHRPSWQTGTLMAVKWQARLAEHLGAISGEPRTPYAARWLDDPFRLAGVSAACAVSEACLPERVPHSAAFEALVALLDGFSEAHWPSLYAHWELGLLG